MKISCSTACTLLVALLTSALSSRADAAVVMVKGKTTSSISATVVKRNQLVVTDANGGWYQQEMEMFQYGAANSPYKIELPLRITSSNGTFQVTVDEALILRHTQTPTLQFQAAEIGMASVEGSVQALAVGRPTVFHNPPAAQPLQDSIGDYRLHIDALPPKGDFKTTAGIYQGELKLTFEPVAKAEQ
ncbi:hypothetical protein [Serratia silvae]|uniref:Fimbrial protein n=1 Tax=Serratia silvae TaxID=2824122 RepID=A0ABT0KC36_9GAMM|nr:hypothetical protein [Serratia silvae]MCL1029586.1 hypothetical protein [Serratia silvae]